MHLTIVTLIRSFHYSSNIIFIVFLIHCTMTTLFSTTHANEADPVLFV